MLEQRSWMAGLFAVVVVIGCSTVESAVEAGVDEAQDDGMEEVDDRADQAVDDLDSEDSDDSGSSSDSEDSDDSSSSFGSDDSDDREVSRSTKNQLRLCVSDAEAAVTKADEMLADKDDEMYERDIQRYKQDIRDVKKECIESDEAEKFRGLSKFEKVKKNYKEAKRKLDKYEKREKEEMTAAMEEGIGDPEMIRKRWDNRPKRCKSTDLWNKKMGYADQEEDDDGAANISGSELIEEDTGPDPISLGSPNHDSTARGLTARYMCGKKVEGVDPYYSASDKPGTADDRLGSYALEHDPRTIVGEATNDEEISESRRTIYRAVTGYLCWSRTNWNLEYGYGPYLKCGDVASELPSPDAVKQAMQKEYPGQDYERRNVVHMARKAAKAKPKVDEAFAKLEKKYPKLREVFVEPAERAEKKYEQQREKYADIYKTIDPITERLFEDPTSTPPENCIETLQSARQKVAKRAGIALESPSDVDRLKTGLAVGYQITEAMAYCHMNNGHLAKARVEADAIDESTRKINRAEFVYYARKEALREVEQKYDGDEDKITEVLPNYKYLDQRSPIPLPGSTRRTPSFYSIIWEQLGGRFSVVGGPDPDESEDGKDGKPASRDRGRSTTKQDGKKSPVIAREVSHDKGTKIVFEKTTETVTYQPTDCRKTNRLSHWELRGNRMEAVYDVECRPVGDEKTEQVEHQHDPVVVPADQAELVEPGTRIEVFNNTRSIGDAAILRAWEGDGSGDPAIYEMMRLD